MKSPDCSDLYADGRHYDGQTTGLVDDIPFYLEQIRRYGTPVLELACGTGRITIPIAEQGIEIAGIDVSDSMMAQGKAKAAGRQIDIDWVKGDCRSFRLDRKFNIIFYPINSIAHLHETTDFEACFSCVKKHLTETGRFIIDIFNPRLDILRRDPDARYPVAEYDDPDGQGRVVITESNVYDAATQINHIKWFFKVGETSQEKVVELNMRILFPRELDALLKYNGFEIEHKYGNYDESPFEACSPKQLVICKVNK